MSERGYGQVVRCSLLSHNSLVALVPAGRQRLLHNWEHARLHMECVSHRQRSDKTYHSDHVLGHIAQHPSDVRSHLAHCSTIIYETQVVVGSISDFTPPRQYYPRICCTQLGGLTTVLLDVGFCVRASETRRFTGDIPRVLFRNLRSESGRVPTTPPLRFS